MNFINFNQVGGFPLSTNILSKLQAAFGVFNALGNLAGDLTIISGCEQTGNNVANGVVCVNGEILEFRGGLTQTRVRIQEVVENLFFENLISYPVVKTRFVTFGSGIGEMNWADFVRPIQTKTLAKTLGEKAEKSTVTALDGRVGGVENGKADKSTVTALDGRVGGVEQGKEEKSVVNALVARILALENRPVITIPSGLIAIWGLPFSQIPAGWVEYTLLRGRMAVGFDSSMAEFDVFLDFGGAVNKKLSIKEMPPHDHALGNTRRNLGSGSQESLPVSYTSSRDHISDPMGGGESFSIMNPYRVVYYIQKA